VAASDRDLIAWKKAMALAARVYDVTDRFPARERFGLIAQVQRAAVSVPSNIAEGQARYSRPEFRFLRNARGSLAEVDTNCCSPATENIYRERKPIHCLET
jgi:four helix bundle protein